MQMKRKKISKIDSSCDRLWTSTSTAVYRLSSLKVMFIGIRSGWKINVLYCQACFLFVLFRGWTTLSTQPSELGIFSKYLLTLVTCFIDYIHLYGLRLYLIKCCSHLRCFTHAKHSESPWWDALTKTSIFRGSQWKIEHIDTWRHISFNNKHIGKLKYISLFRLEQNMHN